MATPRALFGQRGSDYGAFISRPGFNVLTCDDRDLLLSSADQPVSVAEYGVIDWSSKVVDDGAWRVTIGDLGYYPVILGESPDATYWNPAGQTPDAVEITMTNRTTVYFRSYVTLQGFNPAGYYIAYTVFRIDRGYGNLK